MSSENASASSLTNKKFSNEKDQVRETDYNASHANIRAGLEEVDQGLDNRPPWLLTRTEAKLLGIAGVGFFLDGVFTYLLPPFHID